MTSYLPNLNVLVPDNLLEDVARRVPLVLEAELEGAHVVHGRARDRAPSDLYPVEPLDAGGGGVRRRGPVALLGGFDRRRRLGLVRGRRHRILRGIHTVNQLRTPPFTGVRWSKLATHRLGGSAAKRRGAVHVKGGDDAARELGGG